MRVLFVYRSSRSVAEYAAVAGAAPDTPLYGLNHLRAQGVRAEYDDADRSWQDRKFSVLRILEQMIVGRTGLGWNLRQALSIARRMRHYDVVFATTDSTGLPLAFLKRLLGLRTPLVMASQGLSQYLQTLGLNGAFRLHRWSLSAVDHVVVYGRGERDDLISLFGVPTQRVHWIPFGTDIRFFARQRAQEVTPEEPFALAVGRDIQRDWVTLRQAIGNLSFPFRVVTSPQRWPMVDRVPRTKVLYNLPMSDICRLYAACRVVVLPVRENNYSFATTCLLDAMAMGKPVVVTRTRAVGADRDGYGLIDGVHCRFVPPGNAAALAHAIERLWLSPAEREALGAAGRQWAQEHNTGTFANHLLAVLRQATGSVSTDMRS